MHDWKRSWRDVVLPGQHVCGPHQVFCRTPGDVCRAGLVSSTDNELQHRPGAKTGPGIRRPYIRFKKLTGAVMNKVGGGGGSLTWEYFRINQWVGTQRETSTINRLQPEETGHRCYVTVTSWWCHHFKTTSTPTKKLVWVCSMWAESDRKWGKNSTMWPWPPPPPSSSSLSLSSSSSSSPLAS